jgi:glycosyltransferase involved in cell wall biosynthesis
MVQNKIVLTIPAFNEARYILETLRSVAAQTTRDFGVLISDNASTDGTEQICREFVAQDSRFRYVRHATNMGAAANFQYCLDNAECEYFMWCGAHDVLAPNFLERTAALLDVDRATAIAFGRRVRINEASSQLPGVDFKYVYDFSDHPLLRYVQSICWLKECTIVNGLLRRAHLAGVVVRPVLAADHVVLSHLLWFGQVRYDLDTWYGRRFFEKRADSQSERVTGSALPAAAKQAAQDYANIAKTYGEDMKSLATAGFPQHRAIHELITRIAVGRHAPDRSTHFVYLAAYRLLLAGVRFTAGDKRHLSVPESA